ncbi:MAG TPA: MBL fold metallo-hydrolase [Vicinamibacterales bacterium]|nr:MBL fold metallo-hydrolase [Vicinamibacterales bacterium]
MLVTLVVYSRMNGAVNPPLIAPDGGVGPPRQKGTVEITYIANEGVLISSGDKKILIDGLHREYERGYPFLPEPHRERIETAQPPFDGIDLILVSHRHLDHFHPESVGRYLTHNPEAILVSSQQVVGEVEKHFADYAAIKSRVTTVTPPLTHRVPMTVAGIDFDVLGVGHGSGRHGSIQNLGHLIKVGGSKLLHLGDADTAPAILEKLHLDDEGIDVAFLPVWFLSGTDGPAVVREHIKPRHIVAVHMPAVGAERAAGQIKQAFPDAVAFTILLERKVY